MSSLVPDDSEGAALDIVSLASDSPSGVLVAGVRARALRDADQWVAGPLPIVQPERPGNSPITDEHARRTLVAEQQADVLYGTTLTRRTHLIIPPRHGKPPVVGLELLIGPEEEGQAGVPGMLAIHLITPHPTESAENDLAAHLDLLSHAIRDRSSVSELWADITAHLPAGVELDGASRVRSVNYAMGQFTEAEEEQQAQEWAYRLITASPRARWGDMAVRGRKRRLTIHDRDWSALVLRDGAAFIAHQRSEEPFADELRVLTHSVHLDAILLGIIQRRLVDHSGARAVHAPVDEPAGLVRLERAHFEFKRAYWRTSLTNKRTAPSDVVLRTFQSELLTAQDVAEVEDRVRDGARLAQTLHAERQLESQQRLERMVQIVSVIVGAFGITFTAAPTLAEPSGTLFAFAAAAGALGAALSYAVLRLIGLRSRSR